jgi:hypothetical protein
LVRAANGALVSWSVPTMVATGSGASSPTTARSIAEAGAVDPASAAAIQSTSARFAPCTTALGSSCAGSPAANSAS